MSADNWAVCFVCKRRAVAAKDAALAEAAESYGKLPVDEFLAAKEAAELMSTEIDATVREDYEWGIGEDGEFYGAYRGECQTCGFGKTFKVNEQLGETSKPDPQWR